MHDSTEAEEANEGTQVIIYCKSSYGDLKFRRAMAHGPSSDKITLIEQSEVMFNCELC